MDELPHATRLVVSVRPADGPDTFPEVELAGTREGLEWLAGQLLAVARAEAELHTHLDADACGPVYQSPGGWWLTISRHKHRGSRPDVPAVVRAPEENGPRPLHAHCAVCGAAIRWGEPVVTVSRTNELLTTDGDIEVIDGDTLSSVCAACGPQYPAKSIRVVFGELQRQAEPGAAPDPAM